MPVNFGGPGGQGIAKVRGLQQIDQNLDLQPFDSISQANKSINGQSNPITRLAQQRKPGTNNRPEIDSFYMDRQDVQNKQINK